MKHVVYHVASTMAKRTFNSKYPAEKYAAKLGAEYAAATESFYETNVVKMVERKNLIGGGKYMEASNTPGYMSPASEAYWSM